MIIKAPAAIIESVRTLFTRRHRLLLLASVLLIVTFDWLAESGHELLNWIFSRYIRTEFPWYETLYIPVAALAFVSARWCYRRLSTNSRLTLDARFQDCEALVLFISKSKDDKEAVETEDLQRIGKAANSIDDVLVNPRWRSQAGTHLRMPLEALAFHMGGSAGKKVPKRITLVASKQSIGIARQLRANLLPLITPYRKDASVLTVESVGTGRWVDGIDYFNSEEILAVMEAIYVDHANNGIPPREIIVDVTGGTALASIIASMVALKMGGRVEYVTNAYQVKVFNPEYADPLEPE